VNKTGFVICLWICLLTWRIQTTYESTCVIFLTQYGPRIKFHKTRWKFHKFRKRIALVFYKIYEKFSRNSFFLKFPIWISTEFGKKCNKFQVKWMSIHPRKKSNSFAQKRTFLSALTVMNKKFIVNLVGRIWGSNLSQNTTDIVTNVW